MKTKVIKIEKINDAAELVARAGRIEGDVILTRGRFAIDAKSILGVQAINIAEGATIEYPENEIEFESFLEKFEVL